MQSVFKFAYVSDMQCHIYIGPAFTKLLQNLQWSTTQRTVQRL